MLAALAGADRGVVAVVCDVARRRPALETALEPGRLGAEVAVLAGGRCDPGAMAARLARARGVPALVMIDYARLAEVEPPEGMHLALVNPPASAADAAWAARRAAGRWLHLAWSEGEADLVLRVAEEEWELRPAVTAVWRALRGTGSLPWGAELESALLGDGPAMRPPRVAARALRVLRGARPGRGRRRGRARGGRPRAAGARGLAHLPRLPRAPGGGPGVPRPGADARPPRGARLPGPGQHVAHRGARLRPKLGNAWHGGPWTRATSCSV